jgi:glycerol-3-phosphate O-acyltransferase 3/4
MIRYGRCFGDPYWDTRKGFMHYAYYRMTRWMTSVDVVYCTPESTRRGEDAAQFGSRVRNAIATSIGLEQVDFNGMAKRDLLRVLEETKRIINKIYI